MPNQVLTSELRQEDFRARRGGAHELAPIELQEMIAVVLVQGESRGIRGGGFSESAKRLHVFRTTLAPFSQHFRAKERGGSRNLRPVGGRLSQTPFLGPP